MTKKMLTLLGIAFVAVSLWTNPATLVATGDSITVLSDRQTGTVKP
ncbi:hypothetical protein [Paenibacillus sp. Marseille-Q4541]|nr:hypothetical protein [Paenibacillus sp. Marseille-Q4541]